MTGRQSYRSAARAALALGLYAVILSAPALAQVQKKEPAKKTAKELKKEYAIKATLLRKMVLYVTWPKKKLVPGRSVLKIGILGKNPFGKSLQAVFAKTRVSGCRVQVEPLGHWTKKNAAKTERKAKTCHIIFVAGSESRSLADVIVSLRKEPIWLIADTKGFAKRGIHVNFRLERNKVQFESNPTALKATGVLIRSKLLRLGRKVK